MNTLRLKSLELNGYKTFASKTNFEFAGEITAIVGPNGSGKSNIADALRWVLGEQAYSVLRGRKTEDMIFSGSEKRARAGMASAQVTFDNSTGWLPIDFSEVTITRRAYRDGQNEYLINGQKVRLMDVNELLAKSALAERTYTVIGQGLVDTALTLNSDERRRLFEEAAGIGLYRSRKDQALKRLESTRRNLERVEDILAELKPRLRSLERQAGRAAEYAGLKSELQETLRTWYGYHWNRAQAALKEIKDEADAREESLGLARQKQSELNTELSKLRARTQEVRTQLNNWHRRLSELHAGREGASRGLAVAEERKRSLGERRLNLRREKQRLENEIGTLEARLQESQRELERQQQEYVSNKEKLDEAVQALEARQAIQSEDREKTRSLSNAVADLRGEVARRSAKREELLARIGRFSNEGDQQSTALREIEQLVNEAQAEYESKQAKVGELEAALASKENELDGLRSQLQDSNDQQRKLEQERQELLRRQSRLQAEIEGIEQASEAPAGFAEGAQWLLQAARQQRLKLSPGTLGRELQMRPELESAVAAALGAYLDAVLLDEDPETAMRLLEDQDASAALLPRRGLQANGRLNNPGGSGVMGVAADLVDVTGDYLPAVEFLLGNVVVVKDRASARRVLPELPDGARAVTLRGELFHRGGPIEVRASAAKALERPRKLDDLRTQLGQVVEQVADAERRLQNTQDEIEERRSTLSQREEMLDRALADVEAARRTAQSANLEVQQLERQREWFLAQQRSQQREEQQAREEMEVLAKQESELLERMEAAQQKLDEHTNSLVELPMDEQRAQVAHWEMRLAVGERALQEAQRRAEERREAIERSRQQLSQLEDSQSQLDAQEQALQQEQTQLGSQQEDVAEEITEIQSRIGPAEEELVNMDKQLSQLEPLEAEAMQTLNRVERAHTQAQISLARQQESLETLRGRVQDDFGLVEFEYDDAVSGPTPLPLGNLVERLPKVESLEPGLDERLKDQRGRLRRLGSINPEAEQEFIQVKERYEHMESQVADLAAAQEDLKEVIAELDLLMEREFRSTFEQVATEFKAIFARLFVGGAARLMLTDEEDLTNTGIDIEARLPGKRSQRLALLSGGERSLTAAALVFALLKASPTPFCVMDEVDAMLDEANIGRFTELLRELSEDTQFVIITHNRNTVQTADVIYGVTMGRDTASQVISLKLDEVDERYSAS